MTGSFVSVRSVGGLVPPDLLGRVLAGGSDLGGLRPGDFHLGEGESPREAANRAWSYLLGSWGAFRQAVDRLPATDAAVGLTRERWLSLLFRELGYGRVPLTPAGGLLVGGRSFPVSHVWGQSPIHLLGWNTDLDRRTAGVAGAATRAPQAMLQEFLNRSDEHLWGVLSNGRVLRLMRDSTSLVGQSYLEFDLEAMFDGEVFSDFVLLFLLVHHSRVEVLSEGGPASDCWLERWRSAAVQLGTRALGLLREGVRAAIENLGTGFVRHPANGDLNRALASGELSVEEYHRGLLRLVYRLLFVFVAEDRDALLDPEAGPVARQRYEEFFSTGRLRRLSTRRRGSQHGDVWQALSVVLDALGREGGRPELGLPGLGGVFDPGPGDVLAGWSLANEPLLTAVRRLAVVQPKGQPRRVVDYRNLGAEELGGIYESLLELVPRHDPVTRTFSLEALAGNERKKSGSYYTPSGLIDLVLDTALDPVLDDAEKADDPLGALLGLTVCDPACGSGNFLVAAARRIATRLAIARTGDADPTPTDIQAAMRDVVGRCIYGVDVNPMAAELAKVSLWLETIEPGRPLSFLDAHIKVGNSLLGTTPALLAAGVPDEAFKRLAGDDKKYATSMRKQNARERDQAAQGELFDAASVVPGNRALAQQVAALGGQPLSLTDAHVQAQRFATLQHTPELRQARFVADAWCAAFLQHKTPDRPPITQRVLTTPIDQLDPDVVAEVDKIAARYRLFHWHLEFPNIFTVPTGGVPDTPTGWTGGFTTVIGNPPFLNQMEVETARSANESAVMETSLPGLVKAYTDISAVFLAKSVLLVRGEGIAALVQPQSLLAARDAGPIRRFVTQNAALTALWASEQSVFDVQVVTCAPALQIGAVQGVVSLFDGPGYQHRGQRTCRSRDLHEEWSFLVTASLGVPEASITSTRCIADYATATADFRAQYYGLAPFVVESAEWMTDDEFPKLITTGLIDPACNLWGNTPTRFNKRRWMAPRVDLSRLRNEEPSLGDWARRRLVPKLLMANQGKVLEVVADPEGNLLPSVPVISITVHNKNDVWSIAAALLSPALSLYAYNRYLGAGMSMQALKLSAKQVARLPLPNEFVDLVEASPFVRRAHETHSAQSRVEFLVRAGSIVNTAFGIDEYATDWWKAGLRISNGETE